MALINYDAYANPAVWDAVNAYIDAFKKQGNAVAPEQFGLGQKLVGTEGFEVPGQREPAPQGISTPPSVANVTNALANANAAGTLKKDPQGNVLNAKEVVDAHTAKSADVLPANHPDFNLEETVAAAINKEAVAASTPSSRPTMPPAPTPTPAIAAPPTRAEATPPLPPPPPQEIKKTGTPELDSDYWQRLSDGLELDADQQAWYDHYVEGIGKQNTVAKNEYFMRSAGKYAARAGDFPTAISYLAQYEQARADRDRAPDYDERHNDLDDMAEFIEFHMSQQRFAQRLGDVERGDGTLSNQIGIDSIDMTPDDVGHRINTKTVDEYERDEDLAATVEAMAPGGGAVVEALEAGDAVVEALETVNKMPDGIVDPDNEFYDFNKGPDMALYYLRQQVQSLTSNSIRLAGQQITAYQNDYPSISLFPSSISGKIRVRRADGSTTYVSAQTNN